jgi:hypothetical protein
MSPTKKPNGRKRNLAREAVEEETPRAKILRTAHVHRSRAHTSSVGPPPPGTAGHEIDLHDA